MTHNTEGDLFTLPCGVCNGEGTQAQAWASECGSCDSGTVTIRLTDAMVKAGGRRLGAKLREGSDSHSFPDVYEESRIVLRAALEAGKP